MIYTWSKLFKAQNFHTWLGLSGRLRWWAVSDTPTHGENWVLSIYNNKDKVEL